MALTIQSRVKRMILAAHSEAFKEENKPAERLHGLDQHMESKEDGGSTLWDPLVGIVRILIMEEAYTSRVKVGDQVLLKVSPWKGVIRFGKYGELALSTKKLVNEIGELRAISSHVLGVSRVQIAQDDLDNLRSTEEEDEASEVLDPQDVSGSVLLEIIDFAIFGLLLEPLVLALRERIVWRGKGFTLGFQLSWSPPTCGRGGEFILRCQGARRRPQVEATDALVIPVDSLLPVCACCHAGKSGAFGGDQESWNPNVNPLPRHTILSRSANLVPAVGERPGWSEALLTYLLWGEFDPDKMSGCRLLKAAPSHPD
nr:hypothetical protein [Tanacetum cinerariifolium]